MTSAIALLKSWIEASGEILAAVPVAATRLEPGSWPLAAVVALAGLTLLLGGLRIGRVVAVLGGAVLGYFLGSLLAPVGRAFLPEDLPPWLGAGALGAASAFFPVLYPLALGAAAGILAGAKAQVVGGVLLSALGFGVVGVAVALLARRVVVAATAALAGALLVATAGLALYGRVGVVADLAREPLVLGGVLAVLVVAGTAFQLGRGPPAGPRPPAPKAAERPPTAA
ncbi:MAG TPA: hypothetical protein VMG32_12965 [Anaeromyxobacteraceae bacterium]|nr:hypothetical protein [Anaeromyxobacteraceae bacterium]